MLCRDMEKYSEAVCDRVSPVGGAGMPSTQGADVKAIRCQVGMTQTFMVLLFDQVQLNNAMVDKAVNY
jgi:hypothetical protein